MTINYTHDDLADLSPTIREIGNAKLAAGEDACLYLHDSGDCILWPSEADSIDDDGQNAVGRWQLTHEQARELRNVSGIGIEIFA